MLNHQFVRLQTHATHAEIIIDRPNALNALNRQVLIELHEVCEHLAREKTISVVIVSGAREKAFVAGADIKEMQNLLPSEAQSFSKLGMDCFSALENLPQIVIARVQGFALGGGLELALACNFIVASDKARFGLPEVTLGLIPGFGGTQRLARKIGLSKALEWVTSAEKYSAESALAHGLVNHVVKANELHSFTLSLAQKISSNAPQAIQVAKQVMISGFHSSFESGCTLESANFGIRFSTAEAKEGMAAFTEKRVPNFKKSGI